MSQHGIYQVNLTLYDGSHATMSGVCLDNITSKFPLYPLQGKVLNDITNAYKDAGGDPTTLPKIRKSVGGEIDFMIGIKYLMYYPKMIFQLPSGLTIYESVFENANGVRGVKEDLMKFSTTSETIMQKIIFISPSFQTNIICTGIVVK